MLIIILTINKTKQNKDQKKKRKLKRNNKKDVFSVVPEICFAICVCETGPLFVLIVIGISRSL